MPGLWAENECKTEDLSPDFWQATKPHRRDFEQLGFTRCRLSKQIKILNPLIRDTGAIFYLDSSRRYFGQLLYNRHYQPSRHAEINEIVIAFTAVFEHDSFSCTNNRKSFDSLSSAKVCRLQSYDVHRIYHRFQEELQRRSDSPRTFPDVESIRQWFDARQIKNFEDRVRRGLFIPMSDGEIEAARAAMQPGSPPAPQTRRRFRLELWPTLIAAALLLLILQRHLQRPDDTLEYRGEHFKMRLPYASYDDYKDDPNNLVTNELGRIEQTMESAQIPTSFKDRQAFVQFMVFDLKFPGYGLEDIDGKAKTDDGSELDVESVEIPQTNKERVVVVRNSVDQWKLVDDFIYDTAGTNDITSVRLAHHALEYFDHAGRMFRKKSL